MTTARSLRRRLQFHALLLKTIAKEWSAIRRESDVVVATTSTLLVGIMLYILMWGHDDLQDSLNNLGER